VLRFLDLAVQAHRHGEVKPAVLAVERLEGARLRWGPAGRDRRKRGRLLGTGTGGLGRGRIGRYFGRPKREQRCRIRRARRHHLEGPLCHRRPARDQHLPARRVLDRADRDGDEGRVARRQSEEARQDLGAVLGRQHLRDLDHGRETKPAVAQRRLHLGEALDELGGGLAVLGCAGGELQLDAEEREEGRMSQLPVQVAAVELGERDEEFGHRVALVSEELEETVREFTCGFHDQSIARDFRPSPNARD
jgi:hypothetical protein